VPIVLGFVFAINSPSTVSCAVSVTMLTLRCTMMVDYNNDEDDDKVDDHDDDHDDGGDD